jgi:hypothetical protein
MGEKGQSVNASDRGHLRKTAAIHCIECKSSSGLYWQGWRAFRTDDLELSEPPALAFYCPICAVVNFGLARRRPLVDRRQQPRP